MTAAHADEHTPGTGGEATELFGRVTGTAPSTARGCDVVWSTARVVENAATRHYRLAACDKPVVAALNGAAIGAGLDLACMCDVRVAARGIKLGSTFVKVGLVPGDGGAYFLARTIGFARALELVLTGRLVHADEALSMGLVHAVVDPEDLLTEAKARARLIAANAPLAVRLTKRAAYRSWDLDMDTALELAASFQGMVQNTEDHREAVDAILSKRPPDFHGR